MGGSHPKKVNLVDGLVRDLRAAIARGEHTPGTRLPSEAKLTEAFGVSRTVVREALASLRADGLVEARQGAGVFVLQRAAPVTPPFQGIDPERVSSVIEVLEVRAAVEIEAAGLAAQRRSPAQEEQIIACYRRVCDLSKVGEPTSAVDFELHLAIAEATNNVRFPEFLRMIGPNAIPRRALQPDGPDPSSDALQDMLNGEHKEIVNAIVAGDKSGASEAMRRHLEGSQSRYRALLRATLMSEG